MQQSEVIQEALRNAPPAPAAGGYADLLPGEKVIRPADVGDVDQAVIFGWIHEHGGRAVTPDGAEASNATDVLWVIAEAELDL